MIKNKMACAFAVIFIASLHTYVHARTRACSKTMFVPRLVSADAVFELALTNYQFHASRDEKRSVIAFKPFYQRSHAGKDLARFFLPRNKTCSLVRENGTGDIDPLWLNLISSDDTFYASTLSMRPQRTSSGMVLTWYAHALNYMPRLWFGLNTAIVHTHHDLQVREVGLKNQGILPGFKNLCDAFNNPDWLAGRLACRSLRRTGLDDIQLKLGYDCLDTDDMHISPYIVGTIPTGHRPRARYLFEPLVGSKHGSLGLGLNMEFLFRHALTVMFDAKYNYFFAHHERRSFDLCNGDWSRYLLVVTQNEPFFTYSGINSFTKKVRVTPGQTFQLWSALHYAHAAWQLEVGYNLWVRSKEKIKMPSCPISLPCKTTPIGIFDLRCCTVPVTTAHTAQIQQSLVGPNPVVADAVFTATTLRDINIASARNSRAVSNTLYGSCGYDFSCMPLSVALNGSYEFTRSCGAVSQYAVWGVVAVQF